MMQRTNVHGLIAFAVLAAGFLMVARGAPAQTTGTLCGIDPDVVGLPDPNWQTGSKLSIPLPDDGVLIYESFSACGSNFTNYSSCDVGFVRNSANSPVTIYVKGDFTFGYNSNNVIEVNGGGGQAGNTTNKGVGGAPGEGGFAGGTGAWASLGATGLVGGAGIGPGGGAGGEGEVANGANGVFFGSDRLRPVVGGSGGGGGGSVDTAANPGGGGGGGGGAIAICVNGTLTLNGNIEAKGGAPGISSNSYTGRSGGYGSGGSILLIARTITGSGNLYANNDSGDPSSYGRIRIESLFDDWTGTAYAQPDGFFRSLAPGELVNLRKATVTITEVEGATTPIPAEPQGFRGVNDILVDRPGPIAVTVNSTDVPSGTDLELTVKPRAGDAVVDRLPIDPATCTGEICDTVFDIELLPGAYFLEARATFEVTSP